MNLKKEEIYDRKEISRVSKMNFKRERKKSIVINKSLWVKEFLKTKEKICNNTKLKYNLLATLQEEKDDIKIQIKTMMENEVLRVSNEFMMKNYGRKFCCNQKEVFATILGTDRALQEISKLKRELKVKI